MIEHPNTIDLVTHHAETNEYALIMIDTRPWGLKCSTYSTLNKRSRASPSA